MLSSSPFLGHCSEWIIIFLITHILTLTHSEYSLLARWRHNSDFLYVLINLMWVNSQCLRMQDSHTNVHTHTPLTRKSHILNFLIMSLSLKDWSSFSLLFVSTGYHNSHNQRRQKQWRNSTKWWHPLSFHFIRDKLSVLPQKLSCDQKPCFWTSHQQIPLSLAIQLNNTEWDSTIFLAHMFSKSS